MKKTDIVLNEVARIDRLQDILDQAVEACPDRAAYLYRKGKNIVSVSFLQFYDEVRALGSALASLGVDEGHIACIGDNSYNWIRTFLTGLLSRGVFVPVDKQLPEGDILNVLNHSETDVVFYAKKFETFFQEKAQELPHVQYFIGFDREEDEGKFLSLKKLLDRGMELYRSGYAVYTSHMRSSDPHALKLLLYTSGTTGKAKGVMLTEDNLVGVVYYGLQVSTIYTTGLSVLPYHHSYEAVTDLLVSLHHHSTLAINESLAAVLKNLQEYHPDYIYLVPAFLEVFYKKIRAGMEEQGKWKTFQKGKKISRALLKVGIDVRRKLFRQVHEIFGGKLIKIVVGGAPLRPDVADFFDTIGITVCNGYGITECSPLVSVNLDYFCDFRTVGVKLPCIDVKIAEPGEDGNGEICVKGKTVMLGYYKDPEETARVLKDGWFHTGDLGNINRYQQISITGRIKNLIVMDNGKNVYPEEIEDYVMNVPYVQENVVSAVKDENGKTCIKVEVFLNADKIKELGKAPTEEEVLADVRSATDVLPSYKRPTVAAIRDTEFPKNSSNKILRQYN